jgi:hypothetical protein
VLSPVQGSLSAMMLKTFMDETGIHDHAEMVAVGGYISNPRAWRTWTKDWNAHKRQVPEGHTPIKVFHSTDCEVTRMDLAQAESSLAAGRSQMRAAELQYVTSKARYAQAVWELSEAAKKETHQ